MMIYRIYAALLRLYPRQFRTEYGVEMEDVFKQAVENSKPQTLRFLLRELRDFPGSLLRQYWLAIVKENLYMSWISDHKRIYRTAVIVLVAIAFSGPWMFDTINVPAEYNCSEPFIRVEGDFCESPMNGFQVIWLFTGGIIASVLNGEFLFSDLILALMFIVLIPIIIYLPIFSTLLLILRGDHQRKQVFAIIAWALWVAGGLFMVLRDLPTHLKAWGLLLYIALAFVGLITEILLLASGKKRILRES